MPARSLAPSVDPAFAAAAATSITPSQPRDAQFGSRSPYLARQGVMNLVISVLSGEVRQDGIDLRRGGDEEEVVAEHVGHRAEHRQILQARQQQQVGAQLLDVLRRRQRECRQGRS